MSPKEIEPAWGTTGSKTSLEKHSDGNQAQEDLPIGIDGVTLTMKKEKRQNTQMELRRL